MWQQNAFPGNQGSDQSLSDDDTEELERVTYDNSCLEKLQSLCTYGKKSQLQMAIHGLKGKKEGPSYGAHAVDLREKNISTNFENFSEDEVEMEWFQNEENAINCNSRSEQQADNDDDQISDEDNAAPSKFSVISGAPFQSNHSRSFESERCTWSTIVEESNELVCLHEKTRTGLPFTTNSNIRRTRRGMQRMCKREGSGRSKAKHKFSIHFQPQNRNITLVDGVKSDKVESYAVSERPVQNFQDRMIEHSIAELLEILKHENANHTAMELSAELLKKKRYELTGKRMSSPLGNRFLDDVENLEIQGDANSSDEEGIDPNQSVVTREIKGHTMVDLFQEAFSSATAESEWMPFKQAGIGYYGRLQHVMQMEKDNHAEFMKQLQLGMVPHDQSECIHVQILSRSLDAKLIVCHCLLGENIKKLHHEKDPDKCIAAEPTENIVIFQSKICDNVELEVGNMIRIHPPWKEVQVGENEEIILCTYFSQITE